MEKFLADFPGQKFNLFFGEDFFNRTNMISRNDLCSFFFNKISDSIKARLKNKDSLSEVSQTYLETVLFSRKRLLEYIEDYSRQAPSLDSFFEEILNTSCFSSIVSLDFFLPLEKSFQEKIEVIFPFPPKEQETSKIPYYRICGCSSDLSSLFITAQDFKKLKNLDFYDSFWKQVRKEFCERATLLFHVPLDNKDYQEILSFILDEIRLEKKEIYAISSKPFTEEALSFMNRYQIQSLDSSHSSMSIQKESIIEAPIEEFEANKEETLEISEPREEENLTILDETEIILPSVEEEKEEESIPEIIPYSENCKVEDNTEIQFSSLQLKKFPISYQNFSNRENFLEILPLGTTNVEVGNETLYHVSLRAFLYKNFRLLELKTREFRLAFSVELFDDIFFIREKYLQYEIFPNLLNARLEHIFSIFKAICKGESIRFYYKNKVSELQLDHPMEVLKFSMLKSFAERYQNLLKDKIHKKDKNISSISDSFYELELLLRCLEGKGTYAGWMNAKLPKNLLQGKGKYCLERVFDYSLQNFPYRVKQSIYFKHQVEDTEGDMLQLNRKTVNIHLEMIEKNGRL